MTDNKDEQPLAFEIWGERASLDEPAHKYGTQICNSFREACGKEFLGDLYDSEDLTYNGIRLYPTEHMAELTLKNNLWNCIKESCRGNFPVTTMDRFNQIVSRITDEVLNFQAKGKRKSPGPSKGSKKNL